CVSPSREVRTTTMWPDHRRADDEDDHPMAVWDPAVLRFMSLTRRRQLMQLTDPRRTRQGRSSAGVVLATVVVALMMTFTTSSASAGAIPNPPDIPTLPDAGQVLSKKKKKCTKKQRKRTPKKCKRRSTPVVAQSRHW